MKHMVTVCAIVVPLDVRLKNTNKMAMPTSAFRAALLSVGGLAGRAAARPVVDLGAPSRGLLVRPRASTTPTAFPRCLVRRLRFVWAMPWSLGGEGPFDELARGVEPG